jgi:hypothetical protein
MALLLRGIGEILNCLAWSAGCFPARHGDVDEIVGPVSFACLARLASYSFISRRYWLIIRA